jgi:hypothetical protein
LSLAERHDSSNIRIVKAGKFQDKLKRGKYNKASVILDASVANPEASHCLGINYCLHFQRRTFNFFAYL